MGGAGRTIAQRPLGPGEGRSASERLRPGHPASPGRRGVTRLTPPVHARSLTVLVSHAVPRRGVSPARNRALGLGALLAWLEQGGCAWRRGDVHVGVCRCSRPSQCRVGRTPRVSGCVHFLCL